MPGIELVTFTVTAHELFAAIVPPVSESVPEPAVAAGVPLHVLLNPLGVATTRFAGKVSVNPTPVSPTVADGLVIVIVIVLVPPTVIVVGLNTSFVVGAVTTVVVSVAVPPVPPSVELTVLVVLTCAPALMPVMPTENVHEDPAPGDAASVPPDKLTVDGDPGGLLIVAVIVPLPHEPVTVVDANLMPPGKVSVKETPLNALVVLGLVRVKLKVSDWFKGTVVCPNCLLMVGGAITVRVSEAVAPVPPSVELTVLVVLT